MNIKVLIGGIVAVVLLVIGAYYVNLQREAAKWNDAKEILEEDFDRTNNVSNTRFVSVVDGPIDKVEEALWSVERSSEAVENIRYSKLVRQEANKKVVEIHLQPLNLPLQRYTMEFTHHPEQHRIDFVTVESQLQHLEGYYQLEASPDGKKTRIEYHSAARDKVAVPFPSSVLEGANRETFVNTIRGVKKSIGSAAG
jgi:hypothetical protein